MTLQQQKNNFLETDKGIKVVAFARKWFSDFNSFKLEPAFLQAFYANEKYGIDGYEAASIPMDAEQEMNDYEVIFWFWFNKRYDRLETEHQIYEDNIKYEAEIKEIEASNPLNWFDWLPSLIKYAPYVAGGILILYVYRTFKK